MGLAPLDPPYAEIATFQPAMRASTQPRNSYGNLRSRSDPGAASSRNPHEPCGESPSGGYLGDCWGPGATPIIHGERTRTWDGTTPSDPFARKPIETLLKEMEGGERLHRVLGPVALTALGVGATIGTGIFVLTGEAARNDAGPSLILSFLLAGVGCGFAALCYSELASMVPVAGSAYTYAYATLGELVAWIIGWDLVLEYAIGSVGRGGGVVEVSRVALPEPVRPRARPPMAQLALGLRPRIARRSSGTRCHGPRRRVDRRGPGFANLPAVLIVAGDHGDPGRRDPRERGFNAAMVILNLGVILLVIGLGATYVEPGTGGRSSTRTTGGRGFARRGAHLLRLHRLRLDLDPRRGGQEPPPRPGDRDPRLAPDLHRALRRGGRRS